MIPLFRTLFPDAPLNRRTERDPPLAPAIAMPERLKHLRFTFEPVTPGLQTPTLLSTCQGEIKSILLAVPKASALNSRLVPGLRSLISALRVGTKFTVVHHTSILPDIKPWFSEAGHDGNVTYVPLADYVNFTDWAEDAYVSLVDAADGVHYLMEPWEFPRAGDALIADAVEEVGSSIAAQAPLIFQGGNCLIGGDFWLLGKDYFVDTLALLARPDPPVEPPEGIETPKFVFDLFRDFVEAKRKLVLLGTEKPLALRQFYGVKEGTQYFLDVPFSGAGTFQPIFHIDMFVTLVGPGPSGKFQALVGDPRLADKELGGSYPYSLTEVYNEVAEQLDDLGLDVSRNPLAHWPTNGRVFTVRELQELDPAFSRAVSELRSLGASDNTNVTMRLWHHITWNNCLVENDGAKKTVYLPTFGHGDQSKLAVLDEQMKVLWKERFGFEVKQLGDFNAFAERQGVLHCIKKFLDRGPAPVA